MKAAAIIPARYASTRLPGKPLVDIAGKSMIQRVYERVQQCAALQEVWVATDDARIEAHVEQFGGKVMQTSSEHKSGTDRCAELAAGLSGDIGWIVNVQGDEPLIDPRQIQLLLHVLKRPETRIATLVKAINDPSTLFDPNSPKVVLNQAQQALYFSRHPIPCFRDLKPADWLANHTYFQHIGIYGFERQTLADLTALPPSALELAEGLEQLRWLEQGYAISAGITELESIAVDTPEDLQKVRSLLQS